MGLLAQSTKGVTKRPLSVIVYGEGGIGKSEFACSAPGAYAINIEGGLDRIDVEKSPRITTYAMLLEILSEIEKDKTKKIKTLVVDTLDEVEKLIHEMLQAKYRVATIEQIEGGFGKGAIMALGYHREIRNILTRLRDERGIGHIVTAHAKMFKFNDPNTPTGYDRWTIRLQDSATCSALREWCQSVDCVLYATPEIFNMKEKNRASGTGETLLLSSQRPAFYAKNRYGLPHSMKMRWPVFQSWIDHGPMTASECLARIKELAAEVKDPDTQSAIAENVKEVGDNVIDLRVIMERIEEILSGQATA